MVKIFASFGGVHVRKCKIWVENHSFLPQKNSLLIEIKQEAGLIPFLEPGPSYFLYIPLASSNWEIYQAKEPNVYVSKCGLVHFIGLTQRMNSSSAPSQKLHWPKGNCPHTETQHASSHTHTHTSTEQIQNAASCILSEPCWWISWQSAKVGAAKTAVVQGKSESAGRAPPRVYFHRGIWMRLHVRHAHVFLQRSHVRTCTWMFVWIFVKYRIKVHGNCLFVWGFDLNSSRKRRASQTPVTPFL